MTTNHTAAALAATLREIAERLDQADEFDPMTKLHVTLAIQPFARPAGDRREALECAAVDAIGRAMFGSPGRAWAMTEAPKVHHDVRGDVAGTTVEAYCNRAATHEEWNDLRRAEVYDCHSKSGCEGAGKCVRLMPKECPFTEEVEK